MILPTALNSAVISGTGEDAVSGGLTPEQFDMLRDLWRLRGFDNQVNPVIRDDRMIIGDKVIEIDNTDPNETTLRRL